MLFFFISALLSFNWHFQITSESQPDARNRFRYAASRALFRSSFGCPKSSLGLLENLEKPWGMYLLDFLRTLSFRVKKGIPGQEI